MSKVNEIETRKKFAKEILDMLDEVVRGTNELQPFIEPIKNSIRELRDATASSDTTHCIWREDLTDGFWETSCGDAFDFTTHGPKENNFKFCPYCGKKIKANHAHE